MNTEARKEFLIGLAILGLEEAVQHTQDKTILAELNARQDELYAWINKGAKINYQSLLREFFIFTPMDAIPSVEPQQSIDDGALNK